MTHIVLHNPLKSFSLSQYLNGYFFILNWKAIKVGQEDLSCTVCKAEQIVSLMLCTIVILKISPPSVVFHKGSRSIVKGEELLGEYWRKEPCQTNHCNNSQSQIASALYHLRCVTIAGQDSVLFILIFAGYQVLQWLFTP